MVGPNWGNAGPGGGRGADEVRLLDVWGCGAGERCALEAYLLWLPHPLPPFLSPEPGLCLSLPVTRFTSFCHGDQFAT